jgi:hypothetical protein
MSTWLRWMDAYCGIEEIPFDSTIVGQDDPNGGMNGVSTNTVGANLKSAVLTTSLAEGIGARSRSRERRSSFSLTGAVATLEARAPSGEESPTR